MFDWPSGRVSTRAGEITLSPREADIFSYLAQRQFRFCPSEAITVAMDGSTGDDMTFGCLKMHIHNLRDKIGPLGLAIQTRKGGWTFEGVAKQSTQWRTHARKLVLEIV